MMSQPITVVLRRSIEVVSSKPIRSILKISYHLVKVPGMDHRREAEAGGAPERRGNMSSNKGRYGMMNWKHVRVETVGCG